MAAEYDQEAFDKTWAYLAECHSEVKGEQISKGVFGFCQYIYIFQEG